MQRCCTTSRRPTHPKRAAPAAGCFAQRAQGTMCVTCPGTTIWITPPHMHISFDVWFSTGKLEIITVGAPGTQGAGVTGMHGIGVSTPSAAAVAAATLGLARQVHAPNGMMLTIG